MSVKRCLARKHVQFNTDRSVTLTLPSLKMDPFARGVNIHLASSPRSQLCPVTALHRLVAQYPTSPNSSLFSRTFSTFSKPYFIDKVREYLLRAGIPTQGFSGHSLWKGAAISTVNKGLSREEIKLLGRWQSDVVDTYINDLPQAICSANLLDLNSRLLSLTTPHSASLDLLTSSPSCNSTPNRCLACRDLQRSPHGGAAAR